MKHLSGVLLAGAVTLTTACSDFLDVNTNPNSPQDVSANLYLPPMLHWMVTSWMAPLADSVSSTAHDADT